MKNYKVYCLSYSDSGSLAMNVANYLANVSSCDVEVQYSTAAAADDSGSVRVYYTALIIVSWKKDIDQVLAERKKMLENQGL